MHVNDSRHRKTCKENISTIPGIRYQRSIQNVFNVVLSCRVIIGGYSLVVTGGSLQTKHYALNRFLFYTFNILFALLISLSVSHSQSHYPRFPWPSVWEDVHEFVSASPVCARSMDSSSPSASLLRPLHVPCHPWSHISLDFVAGLPSSERKKVILKVIDHFSNMTPYL